ncbi:MFS transporter [Marininema halotolerans]|uniref:Major Facilitator Superfamily protein n=1 Tax=Marininema halotolerans TaxID=1155944 RepID=A0A1I6TJE1_9BACL|nr:MFS transporter [Marininema halotolerans]SFS89295.1 Major Facilitator Superfamily protein [Marininema halotolerans]
MKSQVAEQPIVQQPGVSRFSLFRNYQLVGIWVATLCAGLSISAYLTTESWYVLTGLKMPWALGIVLMVTAIPRLILMMWGGVIADRFNKVRIMLVTNGLRSIMTVGMVFLLGIDQLSLPWLLIFAIFFGGLDAFFWPARGAILPQIVKKEELMKATAMMQTIQYIGTIAGPVLAGVMMTWGSFTAAFSFSGVALLIAVITLLIIPPLKKQGRVTKEQSSSLQELKEGIHYVLKTPWLRVLLPITLLVNLLLVGPLTMGIPLVVKQQLQGDALDLSYIEGALSFGMVLGGLLIGLLTLRRKRMLINGLLVMVIAGSMAMFSMVTAVWQGMVTLALYGIAVNIGNTITFTILQEQVEEDKIGRVMSVLMTASMGLIPLSYGLASVGVSIGVPISTLMQGASLLTILYLSGMLFTNRILREMD